MRCTLLGMGLASLLDVHAVTQAAEPPHSSKTAAVVIQPLRVDGSRHVGFTALDPVRTGITFTNTLEPMLATQNRNLMNGSGVALGDVDGDGRCDVFLCGISGRNALYRNRGDWTFEEIGAAAGVANVPAPATGGTFADLDGDGDLDLLVSTLGQGVQVFRNMGSGRLEQVTAVSGLASKTGSTTLVLGDIDGDRDLDLYVVNYGAESVLRSGGRAGLRQVNGAWEFTGPNAHRLRYVDGRVEEVGEAGVLYLNDGVGHFSAVPWNSPAFLGVDGRPKPPPLDYGLGAQLRDMNGDGAPDLYICNDFQMPDRLWLNDGKGGFREAGSQALRKFPFSSMGVDFGDLDRDGNLDFFVVEMASREGARARRQLSGLTPTPNLPGRVEARPQVVRNALYRGNGDGSWSEIAEFAGLAATDWSWQPVFLDVDLDGYEDILVVNGMLYDTQDRDTLAGIQRRPKQPAESSRTNLLLYPSFHSPNVAFRNLGQFQFEDNSNTWGFDSSRHSHGIAMGDLDGDGDPDLVVNCLNDGALVYRNESSAPRIHIALNGRPPNTKGIGARLRVEGGPVPQQQEILAGGRYLSSDAATRTMACGTSTALTAIVTWRSGRQTIASNLPPNSSVTLFEGEDSETLPPPMRPMPPKPWFARSQPEWNVVHHETVFDDFRRQPLLPKQLSSLGPSVAWMDLDHDGLEEMLIGTGRGGKLGAFRVATNSLPMGFGCDWVAPDDVIGFTGWVTSEGHPALLAAVSGYEQSLTNGHFLFEITGWTNGSSLVVSPRTDVSVGSAAVGAVAAADYDGDGDLDLFVGARVIPGEYPRSGASRLYRRDGQRLALDAVASSQLEMAGLVSGSVWSDLDNDGFPELILACEWGPIQIWRNTRGQLNRWDPRVRSDPANPPAESPLSEKTGWWTSVTTADVNRDGRLDIIAGNWGLNSGYRASAKQPLQLYHGNLMGFGVMDVIEVDHDSQLGKNVPRRSLNALAQALPYLAAKYPTHTAFSKASVDEILSEAPNRPQIASAIQLESTVFLNLADGLQEIPLPPEAQYAPVFGMDCLDADGDGVLDLFLAQNFFAMRPEWPRSDAGRGLFLRGDGTGRFKAISAMESGVAMLGEQRGVAAGDYDLDGRVDLLVGQNGFKTELFRNLSSAPGLEVELVGSAGNPSSYGSTVRTTLRGGAIQMHEVRASSAFGSKDSSVVRFSGKSRPSELLIRWPGGRTSTVAIPASGRRVRIHQVSH